MSLNTIPVFYYGYGVDDTNYTLDFDEGIGEVTAEIEVGDYTLTKLADAIAVALNTVGTINYVVSVDRVTRKFTISADSNFTLFAASGSSLGTSIFSTIGFDAIDKSGTNSYTGESVTGNEYSPQFLVQEYIDFEDFEEASQENVNESASGEVEVVSFGKRNFMQMNMTFSTDINQGYNSPIETRASGVSELREFLRFAISKSEMEFMKDRANRSSFETIILESTPANRSGTGYRLRELTNRGLPGYFESGTLKFRKVT